MLDLSILDFPEVQWSVEAAMRRAIELSRTSKNLSGGSCVKSSSGRVIMTVVHCREVIPAFHFFSEPFGQDVTREVIKSLRENQAAADRQVKELMQ